MMKALTRKLQKVGNSETIVVPKAVSQYLGAKLGDKLVFRETDEGILLEKAVGGDAKFEDAVQETVSQYHTALDNLRRGDR